MNFPHYLKLGCASVLATLLFAGHALAKPIAFNVPSQTAKQSIPEFARQASIQIIAPVGRLEGVKTNPVKGTLELDQALSQLLTGTGLEIAQKTPTLITLRYAAPQQAAPVSSSAPDAATREAEPTEVIIVGSHIRGAKMSGILPVTVVTGEDIAATGAVSGDDLFRMIPQAGDVQFQESRTTGNLNDARGDTASINIRSLGTGNTLVLLNGRRVIYAPGVQTENYVPVQTVNTNALPMRAIRRVEVLRDGAAAIYGTDAIAGVVNIVTDDTFEGMKVTGQYGGSEGTSLRESLFSLKAGTKLKNDTNVTFFGELVNRTPMMASERDYSASEDHRWQLVGTAWEGDAAFDNRSTSSPWGSFTTLGAVAVRQNGTLLTSSGVFHVEPVSNTAAGCSSTTYNDNLCLKSGSITGTNDRVLRYDEGAKRSLKGDVQRYTSFVTATHDFGNIKFFSEAGLYHAEFEGYREQSAILSSAPISVAATAYYNPFGATTLNGVTNPNRLANLTGVSNSGLALNITTYRPVDAGPRTYNVTDDSVRLLGGFSGDWNGFSWQSALSYSYARTSDVTHNAISNTLFQAAINRTTADAYNPFNGGDVTNYSGDDATSSNADTIRSFLIDVKRVSQTSLTAWDYKISKADLLRLPAGPLGFAAGLEVRNETYKDDRDDRLDGTITYTNSVTGVTYGTDVLGASAAPDVAASRIVSAAYVELNVPVVSREMNIPLMRSLDFQFAGRDEYYSDFGNVLKPKAALLWSLFDGVSVRGAYSEGFRAPNLPQFYSDGSTVSNSRTDYAACKINVTTCSSSSTLELRAGNRDLEAEESIQRSLGLVFKPAFIPSKFGQMTMTVDYWKIHEKNVIGIQQASTQILYDWLLRMRGSSNPNIVRLDPTGTQTVGTISYVYEPYVNLQPRQIEGVDYDFDYRLRSRKHGTFTLRLNAAQLTKFDQLPDAMTQEVIAANEAGLFGSGITITSAGSQIGIDGNPEWRGSASLSWKKKAWYVAMTANYIGEVFDTGPSLVNGEYYRLKPWTTLGLSGSYTVKAANGSGPMVIKLGVRNLEDKSPPLYSSNVGYLGSVYSSMGRYVYAAVTKTF